MRTLLFKFLVLAAPFALMVAIELFVLPIDYFTFRSWEAFITKYARPVDGIFYPNMRLIKDERGDVLGFRDDNVKRVEWITDRHGFRQRPRSPEPDRYDIVIVGDSNVVGSYLDQKDTISEVLERKCGCPAYSYGGGFKRQLFNDPRFKLNPPRAIVAQAIGAEFYRKDFAELNYSQSEEIAGRTNWPAPIAVVFDRLLKTNMLEFFRSRLSVQRKSRDSEPEMSPAERIPFMVQAVARMRDQAASRGSEFVLVLLPYDRTLDAAVGQLRAMGVKIVDFGPTPERPHGVDVAKFYFENDSHWREESVRMAADEILKALDWQNSKPDSLSAALTGR